MGIVPLPHGKFHGSVILIPTPMPNQNIDSQQTGLMLLEDWAPNGAYTSRNSFSYVSHHIRNMANSVSTPGFKKKRPRGTLQMNPVSVRKYTELGPRGVLLDVEANSVGDPVSRPARSKLSGAIGTYFQFPFDKPGLEVQEITSSDATCRNKLLLKLKDQKVNLAQALAERHQTVDLIAKTATRIADAMVDLKRGNLALAADALGVKVSKRANARYRKSFRKDQPKSIANGWLELQYGWRPLLNDVYGSAEVLANSQFNKRTWAKVSAVDVVDRSWTRNDTVLSGLVPAVSRHHVKHITKYVIYFSTGNEFTSSLSQLGITNPGLIAWELTPWSFVVDWFLPIGNWLSTFDATLGLEFEKGTRSTLVVTKAIRRCDSVNVRAPYVLHEVVQADQSFEWVDYDRFVLRNFPINGFPSFKNPVSLEHAANALALLTQAFKLSKK